MIYYHVRDGERQALTVFTDGEPIVLTDNHPNFEAALEAAKAGNTEDVRRLADAANFVASNMENLTERVSVSGGRVFFDGDEIDNSLSRHLVAALREDGAVNWEALANFWERIATNPNSHSREQLYDWLRAHDIEIDAYGYLVAYKGVEKAADGALHSLCAGEAYVNGVLHEGRIPNEVGSVVTMPRDTVEHDPSSPCSTGLHVGTYSYAQGYARGAMLRVLVNPRDVVSVPTDAGGEKVRVCRYQVLEIIEAAPTPTPIAKADTDGECCDDEYCECCDC